MLVVHISISARLGVFVAWLPLGCFLHLILCLPSFCGSFVPALSFGFACPLLFDLGRLKKILVHHYCDFAGMWGFVKSSTFGEGGFGCQSFVGLCWVGLVCFVDLCWVYRQSFADLCWVYR